MSELQNSAEAAGLIYYAFMNNAHQDNANYLVFRYFISQPSDCQIILNGPWAHGALVVNTNYKVTIISLPKHTMDLSLRKKRLSSLLGNNYSYAISVYARLDFIKDLLTLSTNDAKIDNLKPVSDFSAH